MRWLPVAAAILLAAFIVSQYYPGREGIGYARVIDPGERLEVLSSHSSVWVRTSAGEVLHPGDWMRTPESAAAEILWHDFCHLTLEPGTLARIPDNPQPDHVILLSGSILSDVRVGEKNFRVLTPAGSVTGSLGRFSVQVRDVALTNLQVEANGAEILSGTVVPVGEVSVRTGSVTVEVPGATSTIAAGQAAAIAGSQVTGLNAVRASADASLSIVPQVAAGGTISSTLTEVRGRPVREPQCRHISLKKLLECATGDRVRMEEEVAVTGKPAISGGIQPGIRGFRHRSIAAAAGFVATCESATIRCCRAAGSTAGFRPDNRDSIPSRNIRMGRSPLIFGPYRQAAHFKSCAPPSQICPNLQLKRLGLRLHHALSF